MKLLASKKFWLALVGVVLVVFGAWLAWDRYLQTAEEADDLQRPAETEEPVLSLEERFVERYYEVDLPGVEAITEPPEITGDPEADAHIRQLAEARGYRLQFIPTGRLTEVDGERMQPETAEAWEELQAAARAEGVYIGLISAYRSVSTQRVIFDSQLRQRADEHQGSPYTAAQIASGEIDEVIDEVLSQYSPPGYSKHHSGHTIDINDTLENRPFTEFGLTPAFAWLSENDYQRARQFGFLPSYPEGVDNLGPDPELWEFVWVGVENTEF